MSLGVEVGEESELGWVWMSPAPVPGRLDEAGTEAIDDLCGFRVVDTVLIWAVANNFTWMVRVLLYL